MSERISGITRYSGDAGGGAIMTGAQYESILTTEVLQSPKVELNHYTGTIVAIHFPHRQTSAYSIFVGRTDGGKHKGTLRIFALLPDILIARITLRVEECFLQ